MDSLAANFKKVAQRAAAAACRVQRKPEEIVIIAVTKNQSVDTIKEGIQAGIGSIGENRVQELLSKYDALAGQVQWHFIGHLQTNKVKYIIDKVQLIHSLDNLGLAEEIHRRGEQRAIYVNVLVQVNVSGEESKFGLAPEEVIPFIETVSRQFKRVKIKGLMTIAPFDEAEEVRPFFRNLRELADYVRMHNIEGVEMQYLSMGMTNDFEVAIEEGANMVRVGRAIFPD